MPYAQNIRFSKRIIIKTKAFLTNLGTSGTIPYEKKRREPSPTAVKQLFEILTALAFPSGEGGPLAVEEVCRKIKIPMVFRDVEAPSPTIVNKLTLSAPSPYEKRGTQGKQRPPVRKFPDGRADNAI